MRVLLNQTAKDVKACQDIGIEINELDDLITDQQIAQENRKVLEISPNSAQDL